MGINSLADTFMVLEESEYITAGVFSLFEADVFDKLVGVKLVCTLDDVAFSAFVDGICTVCASLLTDTGVMLVCTLEDVAFSTFVDGISTVCKSFLTDTGVMLVF